jgi:hypothetical protein
MPRSFRRLTTALLWLAIALMPLRGLAAAWMPGTAAPQAVGAAAHGPALPGASVAADGHDAAGPCHSSAADGEDATAPVSGHTCSLCDLCNASALRSAEPPVLAAAAPQAAPVDIVMGACPWRVLEGPFRPPRARLV